MQQSYALSVVSVLYRITVPNGNGLFECDNYRFSSLFSANEAYLPVIAAAEYNFF
jgi:hypothetical protein